MLVESKISFGSQQKAESRPQKIPIKSPLLSKAHTQKDIYFGQETSTPNNTEKKDKKLSMANNALNAFALTAYAVLVGSALFLTLTKPGITKDSEKAQKYGKKLFGAASNLQDGLEHKLGKTDSEKPSLIMKIGEYFGELKENSEELTNNLVYGFGTLVVMPLVILFSPIGKKDATPEDRLFTVFRQPISFGTLFAAQLTVEKLVKNLVPELNKYELINEKYKSNTYAAKEKFKEKFEEHYSDDKEKKAILDKCSEYFEEKYKKITDKIDSIDKDRKADNLPNKEKDNLMKDYKEKTSLKGIVEKLRSLQKTDKPDIAGFLADSVVTTKTEYRDFYGDKEGKGGIKNLLEGFGLHENLIKEAEEMFIVNRRAGAIKNTSSVVLNSVISQSIGLIALTFVYGKFMKGFTNYKQSLSDKAIQEYEQKKSAEKGGVQ